MDNVGTWQYDPRVRPVEWMRWAQVFYGMIVHTRQHNPGKLLFSQNPNEMQEIYRYRLANYEPITLGGISRAKNEIFNPIINGNFSISQIDPNIQEFIKEQRFGANTTAHESGMNYWQYLRTVICERMVDDPNGFKTWLPSGGGLYTNTEYLEPEPYMIYSISVVSFNKDHITFYKPEDNLNPDKNGNISTFWTITKEAYYRHNTMGTTNDDGLYEYQTELVYYHNLGYLPLTQHIGIPETQISVYDYKTRNKTAGEVIAWSPMPGTNVNPTNYGVMLPFTVNYNESLFCGYVPMADCALQQHDNYRAAMIMTANPIRVVQMMDCDECSGTGRIWADNGSGVAGSVACGKCNATGSTLIRTPYGEYQQKLSDTDKGPNAGRNTELTDPVRYVSPPTDGLRHLAEATWEYLNRAEKEVYQFYSDKVRSGDAEETVREGKYAMISRVSDAVFDFAEKDLNILAALRNPTNPQKTIIVKPKGFDVPDEEDLLEEMKMLNEAEAPAPVKLKKQIDLAKQIFTGEQNAGRLIELPALFDTLNNLTADEINTLLTPMTPEEGNDLRRRHLYTGQVLASMISEHGDGWLDRTISEQLADMEAKYKELTASVATTANPML